MCAGEVHGDLKRGTKIICTLKEDQSEFLEERRLKDLVRRGSLVGGCQGRAGMQPNVFAGQWRRGGARRPEDGSPYACPSASSQ